MQHTRGLFAALAAPLLCTLAFLPACNSVDPALDEVPRMLRGRWFLSEVAGVDVAALEATGVRLPEILIDTDGSISGFGGVNRFGSSLNLDVLGAGQFMLTSIASTMMAGEPAAMERESIFLQALQDARAYRLEADRLELLDLWSDDEDEPGEVLLVLRRTR